LRRSPGWAKVLAETLAENLAEPPAENLAEALAGNLAEAPAENLAEPPAENLAGALAESLAEVLAEDLAETLAENLVEALVEGLGLSGTLTILSVFVNAEGCGSSQFAVGLIGDFGGILLISKSVKAGRGSVTIVSEDIPD